jgi:hypothetical protein
MIQKRLETRFFLKHGEGKAHGGRSRIRPPS